MSEPNWDELREQMMGMTMAELRPIRRDWFHGCLGGLSGKAAVVGGMVTQMRHWWRLPDGYGRGRVKNVIRDIWKAWEDGL